VSYGIEEEATPMTWLSIGVIGIEEEDEQVFHLVFDLF
jgi:hypothetical protein